jgi:hypothetical protein
MFRCFKQKFKYKLFFKGRIGYEKQGVNTLFDWEPSTNKEVQEYLYAVLDILEKCINENDRMLSTKAKEILGSKIRMLEFFKYY